MCWARIVVAPGNGCHHHNPSEFELVKLLAVNGGYYSFLTANREADTLKATNFLAS